MAPSGPSAPMTAASAAGAASAPRVMAPARAASGLAMAASAAAAPASGASAPARPDPAAPRPFADVIKDATQQAGFVPLWRKDERLWLEIPTDLLDKPFLFSANIASSVGERGLYASQMGPSWLAVFRKVHNQVQLVALNTNFVATGAPMKATVEQSFSNSLLGSSAVASAPHPERKSVLIDGSFLLSDIPGYSTQLEQAYRVPYGLDRGNSSFEKTRVTVDLSTINARIHFATPRISAPPLAPSPFPLPPPPSTTPDPRSFFVGYVYSFTKLPDQPMPVRRADPRVGHFTDVVTDLSNDLKVNPRVHYINRWRLEKADPAAALSEPKQPIVFWMDKNIPQQYRGAVEAGILEWNKAFEKIGFKNAIVARQQPDDADFDTLDARHASIRWFAGADVGFARGPSHSDPRTGEIIDADIAMSDFGRSARRFFTENLRATGGESVPGPNASPFATPYSLPWQGRQGVAACNYAQEKAAEMDFTFDLLEARGEIKPDSPEAEAFVRGVITETITHEVGHVLGLKHNFKASTVYTRAQLQDKDFTEKNGLSASVMDYIAYNVATEGERQGSYINRGLGPYDYWAIEYAYKPITAADESAELDRIAQRNRTDPLLAFADDADAGGFGGNDGIDPLVNRFDLGDDPLAYYRKRLKLSQELWQRVQQRVPQPGDDVTRQRRVLLSGFAPLAASATLVGKFVGGMHTVRDLPGASARAAYVPVEPAKQREALQFLATGLFNADSFRFKPQFLASLAPDYIEWNRGGPVSVAAAVLSLQTAALDRLLSPGTASRLLDLPLYLPDASRRNIISLQEVYSTVQGAVWSEVKSGQEIDRLRRNLQREHLKRVQALLTRGSLALPPDALSLVRLNAVELQSSLRRASAKPGLSVESRAHLQDSLAALTEALRASMTRS
jgi:Met-zincin/Domain of unknown function (DUF5117)/Domain of unknown function (DUF5118)